MTIQDIIISTTITILPIGMTLPGTSDACGGDFAGMYNGEGIYICDLKDGYQDFYIEHEKAHIIYSNLTDKQKKKYERIYKLHHKRGLNAFYRDYGYNDMEESFCDDYALLMTKKQVNKYTQKRINLIRQILKS